MRETMTVQDLIQVGNFDVLNVGDDVDREIKVLYCCDLLSIAMGRLPADAAWVTVMANINTLAVASLTDAACIILAEGTTLDEPTCNKAKEQNITVFATSLPVFEAALMVYQQLNA